MRFLPNIPILMLGLCMSAQAQALMLMQPVCHTPEQNYSEYIRSILSRITPIRQESNTSSIAFIIATAITAKYSVPSDTNKITELLNREIPNNRLVTLLDIKRVIHQLGYQVEGKRSERSEDTLALSNQVRITQDPSKNFIALINASDDYIYAVYGAINQEALICPIDKFIFMRSYATQSFLIFD